MTTYPYIEIGSIDALPVPAAGTNLIVHYVFQYIDFTKVPEYAEKNQFIDCCFLGCQLTAGMIGRLESSLVLPRIGMIYKAFPESLYTGDTLYEGYDPNDPETFETCFDTRVYRQFVEQGRDSNDLRVMLSRTLHDHYMNDAMNDFLSRYDRRDIVGIMGGHGMKRTDPFYASIVRISKTLTEKGKLMISGGGPGAMEATHLGAWLAGCPDDTVDDALQILSVAPSMKDPMWLSSAFAVRRKYPQRRYHSLGIPTWIYGHEPPTPFATQIAKYFQNSIREDNILAIAAGGVIYTPGLAGTLQEIFQHAAQNHYKTTGFISPMVFMGVDYYQNQIPVYPMLEDLQARGTYQNLVLSLTDDPALAVNLLMQDRT